MWRALWIVGMIGCGATNGEPASEPSSASAPHGPRRARATRGAAIVQLTDVPGALVDGNAPPPPPGAPAPAHAALTASCDGDALACSEAGTIVRGAESYDAALEGLRGVGFTIVSE